MSGRYQSLNPQKGLIWRIVHVSNIPWILDNGLYSANSTVQSPNYQAIGNPELIQKRTQRAVPIEPYGTLSDYVPFYFTPFSPMMYNIFTGIGVAKRRNEEIVILVSSIPKLLENNIPFVFTDRHAYTQLAEFFNQYNDLVNLDWNILQNRDFQRDANDPEKIERYQAEALVYQHLPVQSLLGIVCYTEDIKLQLEQAIQVRSLALEVHKMTQWYF
ncbi:type II toxin-antitoxin system toxin DNA ADP-ribosyl transferase DarT [Marinomonas fungiae]|uniref:DarT domain-containing protein n=1 Tax=Marinomonas fungiae TaxID=1137284 RepID=A0A0K6IIK1_9GAMM|nr:DUF4433 domain-containing protein [Marinomonas fungiae]CUB02933.1 Domain of unknown function (DUF4433) [Marinomonas fungiae]